MLFELAITLFLVGLSLFSGYLICTDFVSVREDRAVSITEVSQVLFRLSRWENLEYAKKV